MPETGSEETGRKRASKKQPAGASRDLAYKPSRKPVLSRSSPYNIRQGEQSVSQLEGEVVVSEVVEGAAHEVPVAEEGTVIVEKEFEEEDRMSGRGSEAGDMVEILRLMSERDAQFREDLAAAAEERRKEEEVRRRVEVELRRADEEARRMELREMFRQMNEVERGRGDRHKEAEVERRKADEDARKERREEEERKREKKERLKEKLTGLGVVKESVDLGMYLDRFERIMRECEVEADEWVEKLFARLNEKLCVRVNELRDEGAGYEVIKRALLKAVGETTITYGHRIFELTG